MSIVALNTPHATTCPSSPNMRQQTPMSQDVTRGFTPKLRQVVGADETVGPHKVVFAFCLHVFTCFHRSSRSSHSTNRKEMKRNARNAEDQLQTALSCP